ncbi:MAG: 3-oxoacyl-[acyl-carrier-protein] reductase [Bacteroidales bacterium]|jgi:3-oxoacyl-[acyl-carrier protein] reductase|nr:3-oxoacyl-[acyl-carrier-protein] reductase [Bacteroidales bacterium]
MELLKGKVALITGAARGIGKAIALKYVQEGADVAFTDIKADDSFKATEAELKAYGTKVKGYVSDAANFEAAQALADEIINDFGQLDILVNNAGITRDNLLMRMTEDQWDIIMNINLKSVFNMTKVFMRQMMKQRQGSIINLSSVVGVQGNAGQANYAASKAGIIGFTKSVAQELGSRNIRANAIAPGFIETEMTAVLPEDVKKGWYEQIPLKRAGKPEEVADVAVFLGSDMSTFVSGQTIHVCGAMLT